MLSGQNTLFQMPQRQDRRRAEAPVCAFEAGAEKGTEDTARIEEETASGPPDVGGLDVAQREAVMASVGGAVCARTSCSTVKHSPIIKMLA